MTATGQLTKDELRLLRPGLQAKLAEEQEAEAARLSGEEARRREAERLERRAVAERQARTAYFDSVSTAQRGFLDWLKNDLSKVYETAETWRGFADTGKAGFLLSPAEITKRIGDWVSVGFRSMPAKWIGRTGRLGRLILSKHLAGHGVWVEAEKKKFGEGE